MLRPSAAGHVKAGCDLISQYIPSDIYTALLASYEFVNYVIVPPVSRA